MPSDDDFLASADELKKDAEDLAAKLAKDASVQLVADSFLDHLESVAGELLPKIGAAVEKGAEIALPILLQAGIAALEGAVERRK